MCIVTQDYVNLLFELDDLASFVVYLRVFGVCEVGLAPPVLGLDVCARNLL